VRVVWAPNPFTESAELRVDLEAAAPVALQIFDVAGRRVAAPPGERLASGTHVVAFTGRDDRGRPLARGVYFYRITAGDRVTRGKLVKR
jgi:hypothetical protein